MYQLICTNDARSRILNDSSGKPSVVINTSHDLSREQIDSVTYVWGNDINVYHDRIRFRGNPTEQEVLNYLKCLQGKAMVYITTFGLAYIQAYEEGLNFGTFERFDGFHDFRLRSITHYNDSNFRAIRVLRYDDPYVSIPDLSRVPIWLPHGS